MSMTRWKRLAVGGVVWVAMATPALAQKPAEAPQPPFDVPGLPHSRIWVPWVFAFLFAGGCIAVAFKNPHRSHLD